ncbi:MAG: hypothetical protein KA354_08060 [Phycisphaerae bacterium]|nr:hypothetical protein [Phycisphaerae bacterium]
MLLQAGGVMERACGRPDEAKAWPHSAVAGRMFHPRDRATLWCDDVKAK